MTEPVPVRDAATVILARDGDDGLEVFMLRRSAQSKMFAGAYVFPGGAVDEADRHADLEPVCQGRSDDGASAMIGVESGGLAYWVAAIRECFEEAGVLLAYSAAGSPVSLADPAMAERFTRHRAAVERGDLRLVDLCAMEHLRLAVDQIHYFSHWITPEGAPRRYDTRFFVTAAPADQEALHDERETVANLWVRPPDALERHGRGELELMFPTVKTLEAMSRFDRAVRLLDAAAAVENVPTTQARVVADAHGARILLPGDPGYNEAVTPPSPWPLRS